MATVKRRQYSSPARKRQAATTRRAILDAARDLFVAGGYEATTVDDIARRAGVSKPTVFSSVGNKDTVLRAVRDVAIAGDDEPVPVRQRPVVDRVRQEPELGRAAALLASHLAGVASRYAEINEVLHKASDAGGEVGALWEAEEEQRLIGARLWVDVLATKAPLARPHTKASAVDVVWLLMAPDNYYRLVLRRGWTPGRYERWLTTSIAQLFAVAN